MDTTRRMSIVARDFLTALRNLSASIIGLKSEIEADRNKRETYQSADEKQQESPPRIAASVHFESEEVNRYYANYKKRDALDWCSFGLTILTLVAVAVYAGVAWLQHGDFVDANRINHDTLVSVQRAFIVTKGLVVLLAYTLVNWGMLCAMRKSNKAASDSFIYK